MKVYVAYSPDQGIEGVWKDKVKAVKDIAKTLSDDPEKVMVYEYSNVTFLEHDGGDDVAIYTEEIRA